MGVIDYVKQGSIGTTLLPQRWDIDIYKGDTFDITVNFKDGSNAAVNLTGFTGKVEFRDDSNAVVATPTVTVNAGGVTGAVKVHLDTSVVAEGVYSYDLQLTDPSGNKRTYIGGVVTVTGDITQ